MKELLKQERAVTLIALVLTIIVLLILVAVSIATLTGDNGILIKAQEAREITKKAEIDEQLRLAGLSAKIKKEGGGITIGEYLQELREEKVDFVEGDTEKYGDLYEIYKKVIIVEGKYIYGLNEKDGDVIFEEKGTENKIKPTVKSIEIVEKTETTIKVKVTTIRNDGGTLKYYIKEKEAIEYDLRQEQEGEEFTFENLDPDKTYSKIKVEAIASNGETAYLEIEIRNVPSLETEGAVTLSYRANGQAIGENTWTQGPVTVTVKVNSNIINTQGYTLETAQSTGIERTGEINWQETANQIFTTKGTIYARLIDKTNGSKGKEYTEAIDKIDTISPTIDMDATQKSITVTTNSISITASATDAESGIAKYSFSRDDGVNWEPTEGQAEAQYTFQNLEQNKVYHLKVKVIDKAGNETISEIITRATGSVPGNEVNIGFTYSKTNWTNENIDVTITNKTGNNTYKIEYSTFKHDGQDVWEEYTRPINMEQNGYIYARLKDNTGQVGGYATGNVLKIDKLPPNPFTPIATSTHNSITITASTTDQVATSQNGCSGGIQYRFQSGDGNWSDYQTNGNFTFNNLVAGTNYTITVEAKDLAGNTKTGTVTIKTKVAYIVTYNNNGGTGAPSSQTKLEGTDLTLSSKKPTRVGYAFLEWKDSTVANANTYYPGSLYTKDSNLNLYALWEKGTIYFSAGYSATVTSPQTEENTTNSWKSEITVSEESDISYTVTNSTDASWCAFYVFVDDKKVATSVDTGTYKVTVPANSNVRFEIHSTGSSSTQDRTLTGKIDAIIGKQSSTTYTKKISPIISSKGSIIYLCAPSESVYKYKSVSSSFIVPEDCDVRFSAKGSNTSGGNRQTYLRVDGVDVGNLTGSLTKDYRTCHIMKNSRASLRVDVGGDVNKTAEQYGEIESITGLWSGVSYPFK